MIIALLALALAMIVGGLLAAFFGWDIVLVERGWTMVIAGSISAASGALLLGITAAVSRLSQISAHLSRPQGAFSNEATRIEPAVSTEPSLAAVPSGLAAGAAADEAEGERPSEEQQPSLPLFVGEERRERDDEAVSTAKWPDDKAPDEPVLPLPPRPSVETTLARDEDEPELKVPDFLLGDRLRDPYSEPRVSDADASFVGRSPEPKEQDDLDDLLEPAPEPVSEREPEPDGEPDLTSPPADEDAIAEDEVASDEAQPATIVGTYNSGDNRYVMFSDGSIEAQTPSGVFRFQSLDELKEFIAAGGEGSATTST